MEIYHYSYLHSVSTVAGSSPFGKEALLANLYWSLICQYPGSLVPGLIAKIEVRQPQLNKTITMTS